MKCEEARAHLSPYLDSELDPTRSFEIARHLESCQACRQRFEAEAALEEQIRSKVRKPHPGDADVWSRALGMIAHEPARRPARWLRWGAAAAVMVACGVVTAMLWPAKGLPEMLRKDYEKLASGVSPLDISTGNAEEVRQYFRDEMNLDFNVPRPQGFDLVGGRKCTLGGVPAAFLLYRGSGVIVSVGVFKAGDIGAFVDVSLEQLPLRDTRGIPIVALHVGEVIVCAAGNTDIAMLERLCRAVVP